MQTAHSLPRGNRRPVEVPSHRNYPSHSPRKTIRTKPKTVKREIDMVWPARGLFILFMTAILMVVPFVILQGMLAGNNAVIDRLKTDINANAAVQQKEYIELTALRDMRNIEAAAVAKYGMSKDMSQETILYPSALDGNSKDRLINLGGKPSADYRYLIDVKQQGSSGLGLASYVTNRLQVFEGLLAAER